MTIYRATFFVQRQPASLWRGDGGGFIAAFESAQEFPYLPDVVALEWACHCAYFAEDAATLDIDKLAQVSPEQYPDLILHIHPACQLMRFRYPITAIWHAHQPGAPVI